MPRPPSEGPGGGRPPGPPREGPAHGAGHGPAVAQAVCNGVLRGNCMTPSGWAGDANVLCVGGGRLHG